MQRTLNASECVARGCALMAAMMSPLFKVADYGLASGIFNVKLGHSDKEWQTYFYDNLHLLNQVSLKGFSFNCLTSYSDPDKMSAKLFYPNPGVIFDYCKQNFSRNVALLHDYDLYEFTILVRK